MLFLQAQEMFDALKKKGTTTALVMFEGEQHGFRSSNAIRRALDGEVRAKSGKHHVISHAGLTSLSPIQHGLASTFACHLQCSCHFVPTE